MNARPHLALTAPAPAGGLAGRRTRAPRARRHERFRRRGSEIRALIADLRELTESLRTEGADGAALAAKRSEIEVKQSRLADAVRRDPTFGQTAPGAAPRCDPPAVRLAYEGHAQRGLEHHEAVAATAVQLQVSVHGVQSALGVHEPSALTMSPEGPRSPGHWAPGSTSLSGGTSGERPRPSPTRCRGWR